MTQTTPLLHPTGSRWVCDLCGQPLAGPDDRCNSGLHQGPDDLNGFRGKATWGESTDAWEHLERAPSYREPEVDA